MGRWSQRMLRGGGTTAVLGTPALLFTPVDHLTWTWTQPDPPAWSIEQSNDGSTAWVEIDNLDGSARSVDGDTTIGKFYRVTGVTSEGATITAHSNVVEATI